MKFKLSPDQVEKNIKDLKDYMKTQNINYFYISSFDPYLNEYVPMRDCHRYYFTGFSGSVAEVLVPIEGKIKLYVDGRYHEQADLECNLGLIDVVKTPSTKSNMALLKEDLEKLGVKDIALEAQRTSLAFYKFLNENYNVETRSEAEMNAVIDFEKNPALAPIKQLGIELVGKSTKDKCQDIFKGDESFAHFVTAIDSLAWLTNSRGYHLPNLSSFLGKAIAFHDQVFVFIDEATPCEVEDEFITFVKLSGDDLASHLKDILSKRKIEKIYFDEQMVNAQDFIALCEVFNKDHLVHKAEGLVEYHAIKNEAELNAFRASFKRSDKAIYNTIKWVKSEVSKGNKVSELDLYNRTTECYQEQGAVEQSFGTIAGVDANGSIIHYGDPKADVFMTEDSMCLLDSGGYFESGFATDTTRTFMASVKEGSPEHKKIYTLVLKGTLNLQNAVFQSRTRGAGLDAICRQPLYQYGYDYAHGTGHGVGIHVHEGGAGISPVRNYLLHPGQVISIEPGIYIPGFGGVRLENIGIVVEHPKYEGFLTFESLVYIGFDPLLIDEELLTAQEKVWLDEYEAICKERGTSFLS